MFLEEMMWKTSCNMRNLIDNNDKDKLICKYVYCNILLYTASQLLNFWEAYSTLIGIQIKYLKIY